MNTETIILFWGQMPYKDDYSFWMYYDAYKDKSVRLVMPPERLRNPKSVQKHTRDMNSSNFKKKMWIPFYFWRCSLEKRKRYVVVVNEWHPILSDLAYIRYLKKNYDIRFVLTIHNRIRNKRNPVVGVNHSLKDLCTVFDLITTDEPEDTALFNIQYLPDPIYDMYAQKHFKIKSDICFCGADKGRFDTIKAIAKSAQQKGVITDFRLANNAKYNVDGIKFISWQTYPETIKQDHTSNCILEVLQPGQNGYSLRMEEAVVMNKKLLTNNPLVKESSFYDIKYIQYFENPNEIDWDFVRKREPIKYDYQDQYSGKYSIDQIYKMLGEN